MNIKRLPAVFAALLVLTSLGLRATPNTNIDSTYQQIHEHACTELQINPCVPKFDDDEKWAFVVTWCARHPGEAACTNLPQSGGPVVIAFDHDGRGWRPIYGVDQRDVDADANGVPKVLTSTGRKVIAVVESTNPLVYKAEAGAITEVDAPVVDNIKQLFAKLGPVLTALLGEAEDVTHESDTAAINTVKAAAQKIQCIPDQWISAREFTQHVENHEGSNYQVLKQACPDSARLADAFKDLKNAADALSKINFCKAEAGLIADWLNMSPTNIKALRDKQKSIVLNVDCESRLGEFKLAIDQRLDTLEKSTNAATKNPTQANQEALESQQEDWRANSVADRKTLERLTTMAKDADDAESAAVDLLKKETRDKIDTIVTSINKFERRLLESVATSTPITNGTFHTTQVADFFVVPHGPIVVAWSKIRSRTLTVTKASPFDTISPNRPDTVATSYSAASLTASLVELNVALTHTQLSSPVFGTVSVAAPTAADPNAKKNIIAHKDDDERSGKLAVLVSYPVFNRVSSAPWARRLGVEFGVGSSTATPALFLGASLKLNSAVRLGFGVTYQQVKALDGQSIGDTVGAEADIKRKNVGDTSWYASFSVSLESIGNLFKAE